MRKMIVWLFHALLLFVPLFFSIKTDELFEFNKMILTYGLTSCILALWVARMTQEKRFIFQRTPLDVPMALFLISAICSTVFSIHPYTSWFGYYSRFNGGLLSLLAYSALFYAWISNVKKEEVFGLLHTLVYGALLSALYAIPEHFGHSPSCLLITGNFDVGCWVQDVKSRVFGTFGQPNWLAAYLILPTLLAIVNAYSARVLKKSWMSWSFIAIALMFFVNLLFTGSRSGFLGMGLSLGLFFVSMMVLGKEKKQLRFPTQMLIAFVTGCVLFYALFDAPFKQQIISRAEQLFQSTSVPVATPNASVVPQVPVAGTQLDNGGTESGAIRAIVWRGAIAVWQRYPLFGSGLETFAYSYYKDRPMEHNLVSEWDFLYNKAHNELLNVLATSGLFGLLTYLLFFGSIFFWAAKRLLSIFHAQHKQKDEREIYFTLAILSSLVGIHLTNFLGFSTVMVNIFLFLGSAIVITLLSEHLEAPLPSQEKPHAVFESFQWIGYVVAVVILCMGLGETLRIWRADTSYTLGKQLLDLGESELGLQKLEHAIELSPNEALFHDEFSSNLAMFAVSAAEIKEATLSAELTKLALHEMQMTSALNPVHLNFSRSQARSFIALSALDPVYLDEAVHVLEKALVLAPTDAKLVYNLGVIAEQQDQIHQAIGFYEDALRMKPNYDQARERLDLLQQAATASAQQTKGTK